MAPPCPRGEGDGRQRARTRQRIDEPGGRGGAEAPAIPRLWNGIALGSRRACVGGGRDGTHDDLISRGIRNGKRRPRLAPAGGEKAGTEA